MYTEKDHFIEFLPHILHHNGIFHEVAEQSREIWNVSRMRLAFFTLESNLQELTPFYSV